jgi:hypothetical protein
MLPVRSNGAVLASLLGSRPKPVRRAYASLAEELGDADELKSLGEIMAPALGIELKDSAAVPADEQMRDIDVDRDHLSPDAVLRVPHAVMEATKNLMRARGWNSRAWQ